MESGPKKVKTDDLESYEEFLERICSPTCEFCQAVKDKTKDWSPYTANNTTFCKTHLKMYHCAKMGQTIQKKF